MALQDTLRTIVTDYPKAKTEPLTGHPLGAFIRKGAADAIRDALGELGAGLLVEGSPGLAIGPPFLGFQYLILPSQHQLRADIMWSTCST